MNESMQSHSNLFSLFTTSSTKLFYQDLKKKIKFPLVPIQLTCDKFEIKKKKEAMIRY